MDASFLQLMPLVVLGMMFWIVTLFGVLLIFPLLYFLSNSPNRILSSLLSFKIWGGAILLALGVIGWFGNDLLSSLGFTQGNFQWDLSNIRTQIIMGILCLYLLILGKRFLPKSIFDIEKNEKKSPLLYVSHIFHFLSTHIIIVLEMIILGSLTYYLLRVMGLSEDWELPRQGLQVFVHIATILLPTICLGLLLLPSFRNKKRIIPTMPSETSAIFHLIVFFASTVATLVSASMLFHEILVAVFDKPEILGHPLDTDEIRVIMIVCILSGVTWLITWARCGRTKMFVKK